MSLWEYFFPKEKEILPFPGMRPFIAERKDKAQPSNPDVEAQFNTLVKDLDYDSTKRTVFNNWTYAQKWEFILRQEEYERRVPSPEWLIEKISSGQFDAHYVSSTALNLRTARLSWVDRFCNSGGPILLLRELARETAFHQLFLSAFPRLPDDANELIKALKSCVDCAHGSQHMLLFVKGIEVLVSSIDVFNPKQFENLLYIILPYVFMDNGPNLIVQALHQLAARNNHRHAFRIFSDEIEANSTEIANSIFFTFISGLYTAMSANYADRVMLDFEYEAAGLVTALNHLPQASKEALHANLTNLLGFIEEDFNEMSSIFEGPRKKMIAIEDLASDLSDSKTASAIVTALVDIKRNIPSDSAKAFDFLYHFILFLRRQLSQGVQLSDAVDQARAYASAATEPPIPPKQSAIHTNLYYQYLNENYMYITNDDLKAIPLKIPEAKPSAETEALKTKVADLEKQNSEALQKLIEERDRLKAENDHLKTHAANDSVTAELAKVKAELEEVKAQNEAYSNRANLAAELAHFLPPEIKPMPFSALKVTEIIPENAVNTSQITALLEKLKHATSEKERESIIAEIQRLLSNLDSDRATVAKNAKGLIANIEQERAAVNSEYTQIAEIQAKIIEQLSDKGKKEAINNANIIKPCPNVNPPSETRHLLWTKLDDSCSLKDEWRSVLGIRVNPNPTELIELFGIGEIPSGHVLSAFTAKRFKNALKIIDMQPNEIARAIKEELFSVPTEGLHALMQLPVSSTENAALNSFKGDIHGLPAEEQLALLLNQIPDWKSKAASMLEHHNFDKEITILMQEVNKVEGAIKQVRDSKTLKAAFAVILAMGNFLNGGTEQGGADGFSINIISDLKKMKTNKKGYTAIHYIASVLDKDFGGDLQTELSKLRPAAGVDIEAAITKLKTALFSLATRPREPFVVSSSRRIHDSLNTVNRVLGMCTDLSTTLGVKNDLLKPAVVLNLISELVGDYTKASRELRMKSGGSAASAQAKKAKAEVAPTEEKVEEERQRGILTSMVKALNTTETPASRKGIKSHAAPTEEEGPTEFQKAFGKVRKIVL